MSGLFGPDESSQRPFKELVEAGRRAMRELTAGEVAESLGLKGSSASGWPCPACHAPEALSEAHSWEIVRCGVCDWEADHIALIRKVRGCHFHEAVAWLEELIRRKADDDTTEDLF